MGGNGPEAPSAPPLFDRGAVVRTIARFLRHVLAVVVVVVALFLIVVGVVPLVTGGSSFTVETGAGPSVIAADSLAFVEPVRAAAVEAGDIVTTSEVDSEISTRRVVTVTRDGEVLVESVEGDGAEALDGSLIEGRVWLHLRSLGLVRDVLMTPVALLALVGTAVVLLVRSRLDRRSAAEGDARRRRRRATPAEPAPAVQELADGATGQMMRVQVLLMVMTDVDDVALRFALAELGGSVVGEDGDQARLVRLVGTRSELDRAEAHLGDLGRVDAARRSDELLVPVPGPPSSAAA